MNTKFLFTITLFLGAFITSFSQREADNWFFGNHAGLNFSTGDPVPITGGALVTTEGCSSFSDANGNLLFYTDGVTVYSRNHTIMQNGTNLGGNPSSSQSGLIVPNPNNDDLFYLFTVGTNATPLGTNPNAGFKYYTIDMTANTGLGAVVSTPVNLSGSLSDSWTEKVTAVEADGCNAYWVISLVNNRFYSFYVDASGVSTNPVISTVTNSAFLDVRGYLKVSPNGQKIVAANMTGGTYIYNFDVTTGTISNGYSLNLSANNGYGVEFSANSKRLYISTGEFNGAEEKLFQFDLEQTTPTDVNASRYLVYSYFNTRGALQLASNGKIYWASDNSDAISVINEPNNLGAAVNYEHQTISLGSATSTQGLPPFIQSLFISNLNIVIPTATDIITDLDLCQGDTYRLQPDTSVFPAGVGITYTWTKDSNTIPVTTPFLDIDENTVYGAGFYVLSVEFDNGDCPLRGEANVAFHTNPIVNSPINIKQCDEDTDGFSYLDLTILNTEITSENNVTITYHNTNADAIAGTLSIANDTNFYTNTRSIWARIENQYGCFSISEIQIQITTTNTIYHNSISHCDDFLDTNGEDNANNDQTDGIASFDLSNIANDVIALFPITQQADLQVYFYHNIQDGLLQQNEITNLNNYRNINSVNYEKIYIRVNSTSNLDCIGFGENLFVELFVEPIPIVHQPSDKRTCADDINGTFAFDTSTYNNEILQGQTGATLTYIATDGTEYSPALPNPFLTGTATFRVLAKNNITNATEGPCQAETTLNFIVDATPYIADTPVFTPLCDDGINDQDGIASFNTNLVEYTLLGSNYAQPEMEITYFNEDGTQIFNEQGNPSPLPNPFDTTSQIVTAVISNRNNNNCSVSTTMDFVVNPLPEFDIDNQTLCLNLPMPISVDIYNQEGDYTYNWYDRDGTDISVDTSNTYLEMSKAGKYSVTATTTDGTNCSRTKYFEITESNIASITSIIIQDNSENNKITVIVTGEGDYDFALDNGDFVTGNTNTGHIFESVSVGLHSVHIRDRNGCGEVIQEVQIIRFPKFLTPNGDGINDTWQIKGVDAFSKVLITIFDRHGKIISKFTNQDIGWDGKYLNQLAEPTDYWFVAVFFNNQGQRIERKGHFSLR